MGSNSTYVKLLALCLPLLLSIGACKKRQAFNNENAQSTVDERMMQGQNDQAVQDINIALMGQALLRGRGTGQTSASTSWCGVDVDTLSIFSGIIKLNYNGNECNGTKKTGQIVVTILDYPLHKWKYQGTKIKMDFNAYKVTRTSDGQSVQIDGTEFMTNESGNTWFELWYLNAGSVVQTLTADNLNITFNGSNTAIFNINRRMTFTYSNQITSCKVEGLGSAQGKNNLENWGQTRDGDNFTSQVTTPIVWKSSCGGIAPVQGELDIKVDGRDFELKCQLAVDKNGNVVTDNSCPFGWKVSWSYKSSTNTRIFGYN
jgi:hypothetical protein